MQMPTSPPTLTATELTHAKENFAAARLIARKKAPYFRSILLGMAVHEMPGLGTIGVTDKLVLLIDWTFVAKQSPEQMAFALLHEVMHVVLRHHTRIGKNHPYIDNLAGDLAINPSLVDMGLTPVVGIAFPEDPAFGFERGLTKDAYYALLMAKLKEEQEEGEEEGEGEGEGEGDSKGRGKGKGKGKGKPEKGDGGSDGESDNGKGRFGQGRCGSCAGNKVRDEPKDGDGAGERSDHEVERMRRETAEAIQQEASKSRGNVPDALKRWADSTLTPPRVDWRRKLAIVTRNAVAWRAGAVDHKYDRPGRRQAGIGYGSGKPILPRLRMPIARMLLVVDTSGSMGSRELTEVIVETNGVLKHIGTPLDMIALDSQISTITKVRNVKEAVAALTGGGGTDFRPAFEYVNRLPRHKRPEIMIFATDGQGPAPDAPPPGVRVIWLLVGPHRVIPAPWGDVVEVDDIGKFNHSDDEEAA